MAKRQRKVRTDKFKSDLELFISTVLSKRKKEHEYEPDKISFIQPSKSRHYIPDFKIGENLYIEAKGKLDVDTRNKMIWVKEQNPDIKIIIIFAKADNKLTRTSKTTYGQWATKHGFEWYDVREWGKPYYNENKKLNKRRAKPVSKSRH